MNFSMFLEVYDLGIGLIKSDERFVDVIGIDQSTFVLLLLLRLRGGKLLRKLLRLLKRA